MRARARAGGGDFHLVGWGTVGCRILDFFFGLGRCFCGFGWKMCWEFAAMLRWSIAVAQLCYLVWWCGEFLPGDFVEIYETCVVLMFA